MKLNRKQIRLAISAMQYELYNTNINIERMAQLPNKTASEFRTLSNFTLGAADTAKTIDQLNEILEDVTKVDITLSIDQLDIVIPAMKFDLSHTKDELKNLMKNPKSALAFHTISLLAETASELVEAIESFTDMYDYIATSDPDDLPI